MEPCACHVSGGTWTSCIAAWSSPSSSCAPHSRPSPAASAPTSSFPRGPSSTAPSWRSAPHRHVPSPACWPPPDHLPPLPAGHARRYAVLQASCPEPAQQAPAEVLRVLGEGGNTAAGGGGQWLVPDTGLGVRGLLTCQGLAGASLFLSCVPLLSPEPSTSHQPSCHHSPPRSLGQVAGRGGGASESTQGWGSCSVQAGWGGAEGAGEGLLEG